MLQNYTHHGGPLIFLFVDYLVNTMPLELRDFFAVFIFLLDYAALATTAQFFLEQQVYVFMDFLSWEGWLAILLICIASYIIFWAFYKAQQLFFVTDLLSKAYHNSSFEFSLP